MNNNYFTNNNQSSNLFSGFNYNPNANNLSSATNGFNFNSTGGNIHENKDTNVSAINPNLFSTTAFNFNSSVNNSQQNKDNNTSVINPNPILLNKPQNGNTEQFVFLLAESKINLKHESLIKKIFCENPHVIQRGTKKEIYLKTPGFTTENIDVNLVDQKITIQGKRMIPIGDNDFEKIYEVFTEEINVYPETKVEDIMIKTYFGMLIIYVEIPQNRLPKKINF